MSLDYGEKNIGAAVSDELGISATGLEVIRRERPENIKPSVARILKLIGEYGVNTVVLGYPKNMDNSIGFKCREVEIFRDKLEKGLAASGFSDVGVLLFDERLSTVAADRVLSEAGLSSKKRKKVIDKMAAVYILQGYLDQINHKKNKEVDLMSRSEDLDDVFDEDDFDDFDEEYEYETITMTTEDGETIEYVISDTVEVDGNTYIVVLDTESDSDDESAYVFKQVGEEGDEFIYEEVSEEELKKVAKKLAEVSDEYSIEEE